MEREKEREREEAQDAMNLTGKSVYRRARAG